MVSPFLTKKFLSHLVIEEIQHVKCLSVPEHSSQNVFMADIKVLFFAILGILRASTPLIGEN